MKRESMPERRIIVIIRDHEKRQIEKLDTWRYWEIVGALQWMHVERQESYDAARWCARIAKPGDTKKLHNGVTMEVLDDT